MYADSVGEPSKESLLWKRGSAGPRLIVLSVAEWSKAAFCKAHMANTISASIFKKAKLPLTSKAGGVWAQATCQMENVAVRLGNKCFPECPWCALIWGYALVELQEQKLLRYFQEPRHYSPYSEVGGSRDILNSKRASYKRGGGAPWALLRAGLRDCALWELSQAWTLRFEGSASPQRLRVSRWKQNGKELQGPESKEKYGRNTKSELYFTLRRTKQSILWPWIYLLTS